MKVSVAQAPKALLLVLLDNSICLTGVNIGQYIGRF